MRKHYLASRRVPIEVLLRLRGIRGKGHLHAAEQHEIADLLQDFQDALHFAQRDVFTLQQEVDRLKAENEFLIHQLQEEE